MWCSRRCIVVVVVVVVGTTTTAARHTSLLDSSLASFTKNSHRYTTINKSQVTINLSSTMSGGHGRMMHKNRHMHGSSQAVRGPLKDDGGRPKAFRKGGLRKLLDLAEGKPLSDTAERIHKYETQDTSGVDKWQCLMEWMRVHNNEQSKKQQRSYEKDRGEDVNKTVPDKVKEECAPLLFLVIPYLCNGTQRCVNVTEASLQALIHRYFVWERKKKHREEANDAVIYIVVVLAFYSFGIVFMMANFVRQEQRELEETKMYKQYVKLARDRWLTTRGNLANKLALQALNTLNAVPQTTDANKVTFV